MADHLYGRFLRTATRLDSCHSRLTPLTPDDLRTAASLAVRSGADVKAVQRMVGTPQQR